MRRRGRGGTRLRLAVTLLVAALTVACDADPPGPPLPAATAAPPRPSAAPALAPALALGQLFAVSFDGRQVTPGLRHLILDDKVGTVLLFPSNFSDLSDLVRLIGELRALGRRAGLPAPLLITTDEEGGAARTISSGIAELPSARTLGRQGEDAVRSVTATAALGLHDLGIRLDLAPVADLRTNPDDAAIGDRSFGRDPDTVAPLVAAAVRGLHDGGVGATLKHFPGLGGAAGDPHEHLPADGVSLAGWRAGQRRSFAGGIEAGADAVMTTAVTVPALDASGTPAVFSRPVVERLLREDLGFAGMIVTDSLSLRGIGERYPLPAAAVAAARAGNDLLLLSNSDPDYEAQAIEAVRAAVADGRIAPEEVRRSAARVLSVNRRWNR